MPSSSTPVVVRYQSASERRGDLVVTALSTLHLAAYVAVVDNSVTRLSSSRLRAETDAVRRRVELSLVLRVFVEPITRVELLAPWRRNCSNRVRDIFSLAGRRHCDRPSINAATSADRVWNADAIVYRRDIPQRVNRITSRSLQRVTTVLLLRL